MKTFFHIIIFGLILNITQLAYSEEKFTISGRISDIETGEKLIGVNITEKETTNGTATNDNGYYYFRLPEGYHEITFSYIGYKTIEKKINLSKDIALNINMKTDPLAVDEILVTAQKERIIRVDPKAVSAVSISPRLIEKLPNFGEVDIMRAFQLLPGVSGSKETSAGLYVRGGTPDQNLILFDGMTIYHVDHFYGFFSAFNANSVDDIELHKGGFPAEFGGRISSVVDIKGEPADMERVNYGAGLSLLSANAFAEIPIIKNKLSIQASIRRSYTDIIKSSLYNSINDMYNRTDEEPGKRTEGKGRMGKQMETFEPAFHFYDLNTKLSFHATKKDMLTLSYYSGKDNLDNSRDQSRGEKSVDINDILEWGNVGVSFGWERKWTVLFKSDLSISYSNYFSTNDNRMNMDITDTTGANSTVGLFTGYEDNNVKDYSLRFGNVWNITDNNIFKFGTQITQNNITYEYTQNDTLEILDRKDIGTQYAFYVQDEHTFFDRLIVNLGLRSTYFDVTEKVYYEPRLSAILNLPYNLKLKGALGTYDQYISRTIREDVRAGSRDFWILSDDVNVPVSSANHYITGIDWEPGDYLFSAEVFYKDMKGLSEFTMRYTKDKRSVKTEELFFQGEGIAKGFELLAQKKMGKATGWLAYTYSNVIHNFPEMNNGLDFYALHDQTHEFKAVYNQKIKKWDLSATWIFATGTPYTAPEGIYDLTLLDGTQFEYIHVSDKNAYRLPDYHRLDISGRYNFKLGQNKASLSLSIFNVYNHENIWYNQYETDDETGQLIETSVTKLGFTPNLSFNMYLR